MTASELVQYVIDALSLGALYALVTLGLALTFGIMRLVNFAYGQLLMVGGYALFVLRDAPLAVGVTVMLLVVVGMSLLMERIAFRSVRGADASTLLVTSFAVATFLQALAILVFGSEAKSIALPAVFRESFAIGDIVVGNLAVMTTGVTLALLAALALFLKRTRFGVQMRAAAEDFETARVIGVRANAVIVATFAISGVLVAVAAFVVTAQTGTLTPTMGLSLVMVAFVATVVGGMGSLVGAVAGAFFLACVSVAMYATLPDGLVVYRDAFVYASVIAILLLRPQGIFGSREEGARP